MAALEGYINDTSSALFSLGAGIAGWQSDEIEHLARHAGLAQGIAQVMAALAAGRLAASAVRAAAIAGAATAAAWRRCLRASRPQNCAPRWIS